jgi:ribose transport system ATP-binding protein
MLEIEGVSKTFPGVRALHDVSFEVARGEVHALIGENGAGKSTLMKILSGVYTDYEGQVRLDGQPLTLTGPRDAQRHGIAIIHQELNLIPELTVAENIFLAREPRTPTGLLDTAKMEAESRALLERLNLPIPPDRPVKWLRVGEQQLVEVAKALSLDARLLILDEPTSALSQAEIERLFAVIAALKAHGVTMIYISHKFDEIFRIADRVTGAGEVLDDVVEQDLALVGLVQAVEHVHQGGLAGTVLTEKTMDLTGLDDEVDVIVGDEGAEPLRDASQFELH